MNHKFVKRPVVVEAFQITTETRADTSNWPSWLHEAWNKPHHLSGAVFPKEFPESDGTDELVCKTLEGIHVVSFGDWIIRGIKGDLYPCKDEIFKMTYDKLSEYEPEF